MFWVGTGTWAESCAVLATAGDVLGGGEARHALRSLDLPDAVRARHEAILGLLDAGWTPAEIELVLASPGYARKRHAQAGPTDPTLAATITVAAALTADT